MNIRTKVITTIIAMVCSLSVSATGIAAIVVDFPIAVKNATTLALGEVQGDLWGERIGAKRISAFFEIFHKIFCKFFTTLCHFFPQKGNQSICFKGFYAQNTY